ncbi:hypothetical protein, partial [Maribellus sp. YY47]|uniref:hypothetical protein n=1 Tax=Maribellus sp. YY47 TaxID=2929486 RepID=UPI0020015860
KFFLAVVNLPVFRINTKLQLSSHLFLIFHSLSERSLLKRLQKYTGFWIIQTFQTKKSKEFSEYKIKDLMFRRIDQKLLQKILRAADLKRQ